MEVSKERYEQLIDKERFLASLKAAGLEDWDGVDLACEIYKENHGEVYDG